MTQKRKERRLQGWQKKELDLVIANLSIYLSLIDLSLLCRNNNKSSILLLPFKPQS
jgi:hypothetical protein